MRKMLTLIAAAALLATGCAKHTDQAARPPLTERQRDSVLAKSDLPGAFVVGRAMTASDRASSDAARTRAKVDSLFH